MKLVKNFTRAMARHNFTGFMAPIELLRKPTRNFLQSRIDLQHLIEQEGISVAAGTNYDHNEYKNRMEVDIVGKILAAKSSKDPKLVADTISWVLAIPHLPTEIFVKLIDLLWTLVDLGENIEEDKLLAFSEGFNLEDNTAGTRILRRKFLEDMSWEHLGQLTYSLASKKTLSLDERVLYSFCVSKIEALVFGFPRMEEDGLGLAFQSLKSLQRSTIETTRSGSAEPKLSIGMPAYNSEKTIGYAIESILCQTYENFELLVIDDCSSDSTSEIVESYASKDDRVVLLRNPENNGAYHSRNVALSSATGALFTIHDSDDWSFPEKYEAQINDIRCRSLIANYSYYSKFGEKGLMRLPFAGSRFVNPNISSLMFRKSEVIEGIGYWYEDHVAMDSEFLDRLRSEFHGRVSDLARVDTLVRFSNSSLSGNHATGANTSLGKIYRQSTLMIWEQWMKKYSCKVYEPSMGGPRKIYRATKGQQLPDHSVVINDFQTISKELILGHLSGDVTLVLVLE